MKISPYIKQPKYSELKIGDKVRFKKPNPYDPKGDIWGHKLVTINEIKMGCIRVEEITFGIFSVGLFEIENDDPIIWFRTGSL